MEIAQSFFHQVLSEQYDLELDETLEQFADAKELQSYRMRTPSDENELEELKKLARVHPLGALLSAMTYLEKTIWSFLEEAGEDPRQRLRPMGSMVSHRVLTRYGVAIPETLDRDLDELRRLRNLATHGRHDPTLEEVTKGIDTVERFEEFLAGVDMVDVKNAVEQRREERDRSRRYRPSTESSRDTAATRATPSDTADPDSA